MRHSTSVVCSIQDTPRMRQERVQRVMIVRDTSPQGFVEWRDR
jgi:hypothetical protein